MVKLNAKQLRKSEPLPDSLNKVKRNPIVFVLDEILDTFNIGSMFRLADAVGVEKMYLCGEMETPPNTKIHQAAVGTENWIDWEHKKSTVRVVNKLKKDGYQIVSIEQDKRSVPYLKFEPKFPLALVLGHETKGVQKKVLDKSDFIVELPMVGINKSFNVWGSASVVAYRLLEYL